MSDNPELDALQALVHKAADEIIEHCDSVQIFVTRQRGENETTLSYEHGRGNFYARYGYVIEWLAIQDQYQRQHAKKKDQEE